jgi:hypothetical protein
MSVDTSVVWIDPELPTQTAGQSVVAEEIEKRGHYKGVMPNEEGVVRERVGVYGISPEGIRTSTRSIVELNQCARSIIRN